MSWTHHRQTQSPDNELIITGTSFVDLLLFVSLFISLHGHRAFTIYSPPPPPRRSKQLPELLFISASRLYLYLSSALTCAFCSLITNLPFSLFLLLLNSDYDQLFAELPKKSCRFCPLNQSEASRVTQFSAAATKQHPWRKDPEKPVSIPIHFSQHNSANNCTTWEDVLILTWSILIGSLTKQSYLRLHLYVVLVSSLLLATQQWHSRDTFIYLYWHPLPHLNLIVCVHLAMGSPIFSVYN